MLEKLLITLLLLIVCSDCENLIEESKIELSIPEYGKYFGSVLNEKQYWFPSIPYGKISKDNWFKPSQLLEQWQKCDEWIEKVEQSDDKPPSSEKCLTLDILTQDYDPEAQQAVMVYIPGFIYTSINKEFRDGNYIVKRGDIVFVQIHYRTGAEGFLSTKTEQIPGNAGVLDIILALKWIQKYIKYFGGDPNKITLFGQFEAAGLIGVLTMSPLSVNLFHQVIYQSGSTFLEDFGTNDPLRIAKVIAEEINCNNVDNELEITQCLLETSPQKLNHIYRTRLDLPHKIINQYFPITFGGPSGLLPDGETFQTIIQNGKYRKYPTIGGVVDHPTIYLIDAENNGTYSAISPQNHPGFLDTAKIFVDNFKVYNRDEKAFLYKFVTVEAFKRLVAGTMIPSAIDEQGLEIKLGVLYTLLHLASAGEKTYLYAFKYRDSKPIHNQKQRMFLKNYVSLYDDNKYLFKSQDDNENNENIQNILIDLWTSFAKTGIPNPDDSVYNWPQLLNEYGPYLIIDQDPHIGLDYTNELTPFLSCKRTKGCEYFDNKIVIESLEKEWKEKFQAQVQALE